jgi:hypothetical protein
MNSAFLKTLLVAAIPIVVYHLLRDKLDGIIPRV